MTEDGLSAGEVELLIDGLSGDVSLNWILVDLGVRGDPAGPPAPADLDAAFSSMALLVSRGLAAVGRLEYVDGGPSGRLAPVRHVAEPLDEVRRRVDRAISAPDWEYACWLVTTDRGDAVARAALARRAE